MKIIIAIFLLSFLGTHISAQTISFENERIDYGTIQKGVDGKKVFKFTNTGNKPLIISTIKSGCDCSVPSWTRTPILPGKSGEVTVVYDTKIMGGFSKSIEVYSNDPKTARKLLRINGEIK